MNLLLRQVRLVTPSEPLHGQVRDILIQNGLISRIAEQIPSADLPQDTTIFDKANTSVSIGWCDMSAQVGEPGLEHREDFESAAAAAIAGGFTQVCVLPNTRPALHDKSLIRFVKNQTQYGVEFLPYGAISANCEGKELAEMYDMREAGAIAFTDGKQSLQHSGLLLRALEYVKPFKGVVLNAPHDKTLAHGGHLHEGIVSTMLGTRGIPVLAEVAMLKRDLDLLRYADSRLHVSLLSSAESVALIRAAKADGLNVTASVGVMNLMFTDAELQEFDSNFKVMPPLRSEQDRLALWEGLRDGTIDAICSNHIPLDEEEKNLEFTYAGFGAINLETCASVFINAGGDADLLVNTLALAPRRILGLAIPEIKEGAAANLTLFNTTESFVYENIISKSKNSPLLNRPLKGKVCGTVFNQHYNL